jgi:peptidoglycan/xylan/chitin deacetylase (PgdA/CDA1 family)
VASAPRAASASSAASAPPSGTQVVRHVTRASPRPTLAVDKLIRATPIVTGGVPHHRVIALTFDDGPSPYTPQIVGELVRLHASATFFVVGQQLTYFSAGVRDELRHGFEVGDHTQNHAWLIRLGTAAQYFQIDSVASRVRRLGAPAPTLFRPPYGAYDAATLSVLRRLKMLAVLWSVDPGDWRRPGTAAIIAGVLSAARPGAIVELHDGGGDRSETAAALPAIIGALHRRHYRLVTVSELLSLDPPPRHPTLPHLGAA